MRTKGTANFYHCYDTKYKFPGNKESFNNMAAAAVTLCVNVEMHNVASFRGRAPGIGSLVLPNSNKVLKANHIVGFILKSPGPVQKNRRTRISKMGLIPARNRTLVGS